MNDDYGVLRVPFEPPTKLCVACRERLDVEDPDKRIERLVRWMRQQKSPGCDMGDWSNHGYEVRDATLRDVARVLGVLLE